MTWVMNWFMSHAVYELYYIIREMAEKMEEQAPTLFLPPFPTPPSLAQGLVLPLKTQV